MSGFPNPDDQPVLQVNGSTKLGPGTQTVEVDSSVYPPTVTLPAQAHSVGSFITVRLVAGSNSVVVAPPLGDMAYGLKTLTKVGDEMTVVNNGSANYLPPTFNLS